MKELQIALAEYKLDPNIDFNKMGFRLEEKIAQMFPQKWMAMRGISLQDHPEKNIDEIKALIRRHGTDRYDPYRKGVHHEMDEEFGIELHALAVKFEKAFLCPHYQKEGKKGLSSMGAFLQDFYHAAIEDRGYPLRIDLLLFYKLDLLIPAPMKWGEDGPIFTDESLNPKLCSCFQFKYPKEKPKALIGLLELR